MLIILEKYYTPKILNEINISEHYDIFKGKLLDSVVSLNLFGDRIYILRLMKVFSLIKVKVYYNV